jgi:SAM-dependent methyltransferase
MTSQSADHGDCCEAFSESYNLSSLPAMRRVEQSVLGCNYGGTSWTTSEQAREMISMTGVRAGQSLLDIGAGSGWPALFVARESGCRATLLDIPMNALEQARRRAEDDGISDRIETVAGSGAALPFEDACFDIVSHSDVLCCMPEKLSMLRECRRVIRDDSATLFSVIYIPQGLSESDHARAIEAGPPFIDTPDDYCNMLEETGWRVDTRIDVTAGYRQSLGALIHAFDKDSELRDALGEATVRDSRERRQEQVDSIDTGLLVREIFLATAA